MHLRWGRETLPLAPTPRLLHVHLRSGEACRGHGMKSTSKDKYAVWPRHPAGLRRQTSGNSHRGGRPLRDDSRRSAACLVRDGSASGAGVVQGEALGDDRLHLRPDLGGGGGAASRQKRFLQLAGPAWCFFSWAYYAKVVIAEVVIAQGQNQVQYQ